MLPGEGYGVGPALKVRLDSAIFVDFADKKDGHARLSHGKAAYICHGRVRTHYGTLLASRDSIAIFIGRSSATRGSVKTPTFLAFMLAKSIPTSRYVHTSVSFISDR